ncbi:MAG TPA: tetratricopeptide repeat protein, partial [Polyangiaceae bacterium]|nr:tetratricopeptide repeat protein [Polyangiaceae bacterium]
APAERARAALSLSSVRRRRGDAEGALAALTPFLDAPGTPPAAHSRILLLAAQQNSEVLRARALLKLATALAAPLRAVLCALAGEALLRGGDVEGAREAVDQAVAADPSSARPAAARAAVGLVGRDRWSAEAMERALGVMVPRAHVCSALAQAYDDLGEPLLALAFCQRQIALRPGDPAAARDRLERALRTGDGGRLSDSLSWLLAQPEPLGELASSVAQALRVLAPLQPARAAALARASLDRIGPRDAELRSAVLAVADIAGERGLAIAVIERWLAAGAPTGERAELLLDLARRRRAAGDADGCARALMRAARAGAWGTAVLAELDMAPPARSSDGELGLLAARAEALSALSEADQRYTARAWRELGAAHWDLAGDRASALRAWEHAVMLDVEGGVENFASDLLQFAGPELTLERLDELSRRGKDAAHAARVLGVAACLALDSGKHAAALGFAVRTLELDPRRTDVLALAERAASDADLDVLEAVYAKLAEAALGRYGRRALHYRAARQLERRRAPDRAFEHALLAFEAVPSEGVVFVTLVRLAERTSATSEAIDAIERVASACSTPDVRAAWLRRAALLAGPTEDGLRQRVEVLLRALGLRPDPDVLQGLAQGMNELLALVPAEREALELRLSRAIDALLPRLQGGDGARFALAGARVLLEPFGAVDAALRAIDRAITCDGAVGEYARLSPFASTLAPSAATLVERVVSLTAAAFTSVGPELLTFGARLAEARHDVRNAAVLFVHAAHHDCQNEELVDRAARAARELGDPALSALALQSIPIRDRGGALIELAAAAERRGDREQAIDLLQSARALESLSAADGRRVFDALLRLYERDADEVRQEALLRAEVASETQDAERRSGLARHLSLLLGARGELGEALTILDQALRATPLDADLLADYVAFARQASDTERLLRGLASLVDLAVDRRKELGLLRELATLLEQGGDAPAAYERWAKVLRLDPDDFAALAALEREAERRGDYEALAKLLARRARLATSSEDVRKLRLQRADVLEQRLGRADEARAELEALIASTGDDARVLRVLADLNGRLEAPLRAAPLWLRASAVAHTRSDAADLSCRACESYLLGGDVESARRVLEGMQTWARSERVLRLAVEVERRREDPLSLSDALEELATHSSDDPTRRAAWLVEAAHASSAGGAAEAALSRAQRAAELAPGSAEAQLLACSLNYRAYGEGSLESARDTVERLGRLGEPLSGEQAELRAFLLAEAFDLTSGVQAALELLQHAQAELGARPLLALGFAERWSRGAADLERALACFDVALAGDLRSLRSRGQVARHAAETARRAGEVARARSYLELAAEDPETREAALAQIAVLFSAEVGLPSPVHEARVSTPPPSSLQELRAREVSRRPTEPIQQPRSPEVSGRYSERPASALAEDHLGVAASRSSRAPKPRSERSNTVPPEERSSTALPLLSSNESTLYAELAEGSAEAGKELVAQLERRPERSHDLVAVCRRLLCVLPGDAWALNRLYESALADKNVVYAHAVEHVIATLQPGRTPIEPPPLTDQDEQPEAVRGLLLRDSVSRAHEALCLVWEGAEHVFRRDAADYGLTGLERVPLGGPSPLARIYTAAARALGTPRTPLFQRRSPGAMSLSLALLTPPAIVLGGDVRQETPELRHHLGVMLAAAMPQFALLMASPEAQARGILNGLAFAFGPPRPRSPGPGAVPNLAEVLWESIPARLQRRLRELCNQPEELDYDRLMLASRIATRRAGLFVSGDLGLSLRQICAEDGLALAELESEAGIRDFCAEHGSARSLFLLATSAEYAQTRWRFARGTR